MADIVDDSTINIVVVIIIIIICCYGELSWICNMNFSVIPFFEVLKVLGIVTVVPLRHAWILSSLCWVLTEVLVGDAGQLVWSCRFSSVSGGFSCVVTRSQFAACFIDNFCGAWHMLTAVLCHYPTVQCTRYQHEPTIKICIMSSSHYCKGFSFDSHSSRAVNSVLSSHSVLLKFYDCSFLSIVCPLCVSLSQKLSHVTYTIHAMWYSVLPYSHITVFLPQIFSKNENVHHVSWQQKQNPYLNHYIFTNHKYKFPKTT